MRAVIDTNVLLSGLLWHGAPHALNLIVSGDDDLLSLKTFRSIPIVAPAKAVRIVTAG